VALRPVCTRGVERAKVHGSGALYWTRFKGAGNGVGVREQEWGVERRETVGVGSLRDVWRNLLLLSMKLIKLLHPKEFQTFI
jgi:hypothetical protein